MKPHAAGRHVRYGLANGKVLGGRRESASDQVRTKKPPPSRTQPTPLTPGLTRRQVRRHARRLFRDRWGRQALSVREWRLAERDLVRALVAEEY